MAVTLVEYFKLVNDPLKKGLIGDLLRYTPLLNVIPFVDVEGLQATGTRWQTIPSVAFRKIGGSYTESTGSTEEIVETLSVLGGDVYVDRQLTNTGGMIQDPLALQMQMKAKAVGFKFTDYFINGDQAVDPDGFEGLKKRISNMPSRQSISLATAGDSLKVLASTANEHTFVDAIHQANKYVDGATHIFCNEDTWLGLGKVARRLNLYGQISDPLGKTWDAITNIPFMDIGLKSDKSTEIITNTEDPGDGGNDSTSIYVVRLDPNDGLHGLQVAGKGMEVYDPLKGGEDPTAPRYIRRIDWPVGLFNLSQYCAVRISGFKMAAA